VGGWVVNSTPRPLYPRERDTVPIAQGTGWDPGRVWTGAEYLASTGIRSPDRPARSESLYRLLISNIKVYLSRSVTAFIIFKFVASILMKLWFQCPQGAVCVYKILVVLLYRFCAVVLIITDSRIKQNMVPISRGRYLCFSRYCSAGLSLKGNTVYIHNEIVISKCTSMLIM
jgi:hypothetical protein